MLCGCSRTDSNQPPPTPAPRPTGLTLGDKHSEARLLAVGTEMETSIRVSIGAGGAAAKIDCEALTAAYPSRPAVASGTLIDFWAIHPMEPDGQQAPWTVRSAFISDEQGGRGVITRGGLMKGLTETESTVDISELELAIQDPRFPMQLANWQGDAHVDNCGRVKRSEPSHPQEGLALTISGRNFAVNGATLRDEANKHYLRLTRAPHTCGTTPTDGYDFFLDLAFSREPPKIAFASLQGDLFPESPAGSEGKDTFHIAVDKDVVKLDGTLKLHGFTLTLKGDVKPQRCTSDDAGAPTTP